MELRDAVQHRSSIRAFTSEPVTDNQLRDLLTLAARAPSGGNVQPWRVYVINGPAMAEFRRFIAGRPFDTPEYEVYPPKLWEPYRTNRFSLGEAMYELLEIDRDDKAARLARLAENYDFFGAPTAIFCFVDRRMGRAQWSDLGMFLQTFMLAATDAGLDTCAQEAWSSYGPSVAEFVGAPEHEMLFCGVAIGHRDTAAAVNRLRSERMPLDQWVRWTSAEPPSRQQHSASGEPPTAGLWRASDRGPLASLRQWPTAQRPG